MADAPVNKPALYLAGPRTGFLSLDDILKMTRALTGREPTVDEIEKARQVFVKNGLTP